MSKNIVLKKTGWKFQAKIARRRKLAALKALPIQARAAFAMMDNT